MLKIYCSQCGGELSLQEGKRVAKCVHCSILIPIPRGYTELESSYNYAMEARLRRDFESAEQAYSEIIKSHPQAAAAYWGRAVSRYAVEYQPIGEGSYRLVCHQARLSAFEQDADVQKALQLGTEEEKESYQEEIKRISDLQRQVSKYASLTEKYDVLIEVNENNAKAMAQAEKIRMALKASGLRAVCPAMELQHLPRQDWEPMLYHAFHSVHTMVYVAVGAQDFTDNMVYDAERLLSYKAQSQRMAAQVIQRLIIAFSELNEYVDIPDSLFDGADQRVPMAAEDSLTALCDLVSGGNLDLGDDLRKGAGGHEDYEYVNLLSQAKLSLEAGDFQAAKEAYNKILDISPTESQAYWGLLLVEFRCRNEEELIDSAKRVRDNANYKSALAFATEREQQTYRQVAEKATEMVELRRRQREEAERLRRQQEQERQAKEREVEKARQAKAQQEQKAQKRGRRVLKIFAVMVVVAAVIGGAAYYRYSKTTGVLVAKYKEATSYYNQKDYKNAAMLFGELEDYKDSAQMCTQAWGLHYSQRFYEVKGSGEKLENRISAIGNMRTISKYVVEAKDQMEEWKREGLAYFEQGEYGKAFLALYGFGSEVPEAIECQRKMQYQGLVARSGWRCMIIEKKTGGVASVNCPWEFEEGPVRSVAMAPKGKSAGVVRMDGTVYLVGNLAKSVDVSGWSNMDSIQMDDDYLVGLTQDGVLYSSQDGKLAEGIFQFYLYKDGVIAARQDGTVFCTEAEIQSAVAEWTNVSAATVAWDEDGEERYVLGVTRDNTLLSIGEGLRLPKTDVALVDGLTAITLDGNSHPQSYNEIEYKNVVWLHDGLRIDKEGDMVKITYGTEEDEIAFRKFIKAGNNANQVGVPIPTGE